MNETLSEQVNFLKTNNQKSHSMETNKNETLIQIKIVTQNVLNFFGGILITSYLLSSSICILREDVSRSYLISALLLGVGLCILCITFCFKKFEVTGSNRLGYLISLLMLFETRHCQGIGDIYAMGPELRTAEWQHRLNEIQGAVMIVCGVQLVVGFLGTNFLMRFFRPVSIAPTMILIGLYVIKTSAMRMANASWSLFTVTIALVLCFHGIAYNVSQKDGGRLPIRDKLFMAMFGVIIIWGLCAAFSMFELVWMQSAARTDVYTGIYNYASTIRLSFPFQWGMPKWKSESTLLMLPAAFITVFEILAYLYRCDYEKSTKMNGLSNTSMLIKLEAILCLIMNSLGVVIGLNVSVKKDNRKIVDICSAAILIAMSLSGLLCAFFTTIPEPIVSALVFLTFSSTVLEGFEILKFVNLKSKSNIHVLGISFFLAFLIPSCIREDFEVTKRPTVDKILRCLLSTDYIVVGFSAVVFDNLFKVLINEVSIHEKVEESNTSLEEAEKINPPEILDCCSPFFA